MRNKPRYDWLTLNYPRCRLHSVLLWSLVGVFLCLSAVQSQGADCLVAWWRMEDMVGSTIPDASGNGHDLTVFGSPTFECDFVRFDHDGYLRAEDTSALDLTGDFTVAFWMKQEDTSASIWLHKGRAYHDAEGGWAIASTNPVLSTLYADIPEPDPTGMPVYPNPNLLSGGGLTLAPGYYPDGISATGGSLYLNTGIYVIGGPGLWIGGNANFYAYDSMLFIQGGSFNLGGTGQIEYLTNWNFQSSVHPEVGVWHHVACTFSAGTGDFRMYLDGTLEAQFQGSYMITGNTYPLLIGAQLLSDGVTVEPLCRGSLSDIRLYCSALSAGTVATLAMNPPCTVSEVPAAERWTLLSLTLLLLVAGFTIVKHPRWLGRQ